MKEQLLALLENSRNYTMAVANAMPANNYQVRPVESVWDFGELLQHVAYGIQWWEDNYIKGNKADWNPPITKPGKNETLEALEKAFASLKKTVNSSKLDNGAVDGFYATLDHITHHRGQAVTYLRYAGLTPPEYTR